MSSVYDAKANLHGSPVVGYTFKSKTPLTKQDVQEKIDRIRSKMKGKHFDMMTCVNTDMGPRNGKQFSEKQRVMLCDDYEWDTCDEFTVYVWNPASNKGGCLDDDDEFNDCLYDSICSVVEKYRLPKNYKTPEQLKEYLNLNRNDKISIDLIPKIENLYKININVMGDYVFTSSLQYPTRQVVDLTLLNSHYEVNEMVLNSGKIGLSLTKREFKLVLCEELKDNVLCYDGENNYNLSFPEYYRLKQETRKTGMAYINKYAKKDKNGEKIDIKTSYCIFMKNADTLKNLTKGKYDLSRSMFKTTELIRKKISVSLKGFEVPDMLTEFEQHWVYHTDCNAIIFSMACELENGYAYDKRSCYPSVMCDKTFSFPVKVGVFSLLEKLPEPLNYGIYRIEISKSGDELTDRWFSFNINNYYTHYHIETAKILNLKMELIQDGQANALLYKKNRASGSVYFSGIVNELYNLKSQSPLAKELLSSLWGVLCKKNIIKRNSIKKKIVLTDELLVGIQPIDGNGENINVEYMKKNNYYKYEYARIGVFLTSLNRLKWLNYYIHILKVYFDFILMEYV
jgi:hypothetical protein